MYKKNWSIYCSTPSGWGARFSSKRVAGPSFTFLGSSPRVHSLLDPLTDPPLFAFLGKIQSLGTLHFSFTRLIKQASPSSQEVKGQAIAFFFLVRLKKISNVILTQSLFLYPIMTCQKTARNLSEQLFLFLLHPYKLKLQGVQDWLDSIETNQIMF